jgi:hypothetical protein
VRLRWCWCGYWDDRAQEGGTTRKVRKAMSLVRKLRSVCLAHLTLSRHAVDQGSALGAHWQGPRVTQRADPSIAVRQVGTCWEPFAGDSKTLAVQLHPQSAYFYHQGKGPGK